jgi:RNA polymerase sigma factor (sigma-70 family)
VGISLGGMRAVPLQSLDQPGTVLEPAGNTHSMATDGEASSAADRRTDADHIEASLQDAEAFAVLFERHAVPLHRYIVTRVGSGGADDVVGETFAAAFRNRQAYDLRRTDARPWLFGIATNLCHHYWRAEGRRQIRDETFATSSRTDDESSEVVEKLFFESQRDAVGNALRQLDDAGLDVLLLVAGPGFTYEEAAIALGIPIGTVRSRLSRARRQLRELLGDSRKYLHEDSPSRRSLTGKDIP